MVSPNFQNDCKVFSAGILKLEIVVDVVRNMKVQLCLSGMMQTTSNNTYTEQFSLASWPWRQNQKQFYTWMVRMGYIAWPNWNMEIQWTSWPSFQCLPEFSYSVAVGGVLWCGPLASKSWKGPLLPEKCSQDSWVKSTANMYLNTKDSGCSFFLACDIVKHGKHELVCP